MKQPSAIGTRLLIGIGLCAIAISLIAQTAIPSHKLIEVREYTQKYPLSCEAAATSVALQYLGLPVTEDQVLAAMPFDKTPKTVDATGTITWGNPNQGFVGDYNGSYLKTGYGIYAAPLAKALDQFGVRAISGDHLTLENLRSAIAQDHPVVVWVPTRFERVTVKTWKTPDGSVVQWIEHEHAMVFRGYDQAKGLVYLMDVHYGKYQTRTEAEFLRGWGYLGNQAIVFSRK